jgi:oligopeptide/dipeptide ABC transporter ATP-binding protein
VNENNLLLDMRNLQTYFYTDEGVVKAVDDVSFRITSGKTLGVVGESGCGKSVTSLSIMQLVPAPHGRIVGGSIDYHRRDGSVVDLTSIQRFSPEMRRIRGNEIAMVFQEPMTSLNPVYTIGSQICEAIVLHQEVNKIEARERAAETLAHVRIPNPNQILDSYPHQLSGGMRQRAMIAMALSCNPSFLIADEPTTALDVTIEAQILKLLRDLQGEFGMAIMIITHDLGVVGEMSDRVVVMYTGKIVESGSVEVIFDAPKHPYTLGLLKSRPQIGEKGRLQSIRGTVPDLHSLPRGCAFAPRCDHAMPKCEEPPPVVTLDEGHQVRCWLFAEDGSDGGEE